MNWKDFRVTPYIHYSCRIINYQSVLLFPEEPVTKCFVMPPDSKNNFKKFEKVICLTPLHTLAALAKLLSGCQNQPVLSTIYIVLKLLRFFQMLNSSILSLIWSGTALAYENSCPSFSLPARVAFPSRETPLGPGACFSKLLYLYQSLWISLKHGARKGPGK